ncbi:MotA/TolQ/ExbB proton channel family protein [Psychromonas sp. RZ22]|uniref:MotA/TolQ/ExbB proton channel family protein n=1 Tax=Psychromonas algarum TaxID=2555643 RepID=UPI001067BA5C|nr:MotA/TolQ/ExbB proton channel family protein [Psychromonas sp. RZ22]TEW55623.1 MotA/TolQ/ExbB proton channel family protein [Psychromonas sp. RZ22]
MSIENVITQPSILDTITHSMPLWFQQGGLIMWLLLAASFLATIVTMERLSVWIIYSLQKEHFALQECFAALNKQEKTEALLACKKVETPALNMLEHGIKALPFSVKEKMQSYAETQISLLSRGQSLLEIIIKTAPILGILGTILGLINSFNLLSSQGIEGSTAEAVIGAISQSLIPIATGLSIGLMALLPYKVFAALIQKLRLHLENIANEFHHICQQKNLIMIQINTEEKIQKHAQRLSISEQQMPYHYEFSEETGEINVNLHTHSEDIKRTTSASIAQMYNEKSPHHIQTGSDATNIVTKTTEKNTQSTQ